MKVEKYICDIKGCGQIRAGDRSLMVYSHSTPDAAGGHADEWQACADLCPKHLLDFAQYLIGLIEDKKVPAVLTEAYKKYGITDYEVR